MGDVLGIGLTHYPPLCGIDDDMSAVLRRRLQDPNVPAGEKDPRAWPVLMRREWGDDEGRSAAKLHREALLAGLERCRAEIDAFVPDLIVMFGDDQYENFREDVIPPYAILAYPDLVARPWRDAQHSSAMDGKQNVWGEHPDTEVTVRGRPDVAREMATALLEDGIDVAYAYTTLHHPSLSHAFINAVLFLDYDRTGFPYPIIPFTVNCYGRHVVSRRGFASPTPEATADPPSPSPRRMMDVGASLGRFFAAHDLRAVLMASSSWSHAFLCDKTWQLRPDTPADRRLYQAMIDGDHESLRSVTLAEIEDAGQHELLNWFPLFGAMAELGKPLRWSHFVASDVFNSNKVFAAY